MGTQLFDLDGKIALMFDDMISTAGSICGAAELVKQKGAREIHVAASHGVFAGKFGITFLKLNTGK